MQIATADSTIDVPPLQAIRARRQRPGDCALVGTTLQIVGESVRRALDIQPGERILEVAETDGRLPHDDGSFDAVVSIFGAMSAPDPDRMAAELLRVCRPGGRIGLASWTPDGFIGRLFDMIGRYVAPSAGLPKSAFWGVEAELRRMFSSAAVDGTLRHFAFRYRSATHWIDVFRGADGPVLRTFDALDAKGQAALNAGILALIERFNATGQHSVVVPAEYFEAVIVRR